MDVADLELIPQVVRAKLDRVRVKLHLAEWQALSVEERRELYELPCTGPEDLGQFRERLDTLVLQRCGQRPQRLG